MYKRVYISQIQVFIVCMSFLPDWCLEVEFSPGWRFLYPKCERLLQWVLTFFILVFAKWCWWWFAFRFYWNEMKFYSQRTETHNHDFRLKMLCLLDVLFYFIFLRIVLLCQWSQWCAVPSTLFMMLLKMLPRWCGLMLQLI